MGISYFAYFARTGRHEWLSSDGVCFRSSEELQRTSPMMTNTRCFTRHYSVKEVVLHVLSCDSGRARISLHVTSSSRQEPSANLTSSFHLTHLHTSIPLPLLSIRKFNTKHLFLGSLAICMVFLELRGHQIALRAGDKARGQY